MVVERGSFREKRLSPRRAPRRSLLPLSPRRTQVRLKPLLPLPGLRQVFIEPTGVLRCKSAVCGLNGLRPTLRVGALHLNPRPPKAFGALAPTASFRGSLCFASLSAKKYGTPYFPARKRTSKYSRSCSQSLAALFRQASSIGAIGAEHEDRRF